MYNHTDLILNWHFTINYFATKFLNIFGHSTVARPVTGKQGYCKICTTWGSKILINVHKMKGQHLTYISECPQQKWRWTFVPYRDWLWLRGFHIWILITMTKTSFTITQLVTNTVITVLGPIKLFLLIFKSQDQQSKLKSTMQLV